MLASLQVVTLLLVSVAMSTAVAHALELPGKLRLPRDTYLAVQSIYYPGFTIAGGAGEFAGMLATLLLVFVTPHDGKAFKLTLAALIALVIMHAVFWLFTQPVNRFWLRDQKLNKAGAAFFRVREPREARSPDWTVLRDQWEHSHVVRAVLALLVLALLASAIAAR